MIRRPPRSTPKPSSAASDVYKRQVVKHSSCFSMERTADLMAWWEKVLADLRTDPLSTASYLDWTAKLSLLTQLRERYHCGWEDPRLSAFDFSYSDIRPAGIYNTLVAKGRMSRLVEESAVQHAISQPPCSTRAWLRGTLVQKFGSAIMACLLYTSPSPRDRG